MELSSQHYAGAVVVTVQGERVVAASAIEFKDKMREITSGGPARVILDMANVGFVDSSGLGAIVTVMKQLDQGQVLELAALSPTVEKVFRLTRMDRIFAIHGGLADVVGDMRKAG